MHKNRAYKQVLLAGLLLCCLFVMPLHGQQPDTIRTYTIEEVEIKETQTPTTIKSAAPTQILLSDDLKTLNALQISDAVKHFAGVSVKDYGGVGGLKTVSVRSLGANHTAVSYDGIALSDCQTGQIDLSRISVESINAITLNNGQSDEIFQSARMFASAGVLDIQTKTPVFKENKNWNGKAAIKTGSFGLANPFLLYEQRLNRRWALSFNGEWMSANGEYPFKMRYGGKDDLSSIERRTNTAVKTARAESGIFGKFSDSDEWRLKAYYYQTSRGLPGPAIYYNNYSEQHLWERNFFAQSHYRKTFSPLFSLQAALKYNYSFQHYINPQTKDDNSYHQQEYYLTTSLLYQTLPSLSFSLATDGAVNTLGANTHNFVDPKRYTSLTALACNYEIWRLNFSASLLATLINEDVERGESAGNHRKVSPYAGFSLKVLDNERLYLRTFYKNIFRAPTFNDLYYSRVGNPELKPENTTQYNVGATYTKHINRLLPNISVTADGFYNRVTDKIIAVPMQNPFLWSMRNLGIVSIKGADVTLAGDIDFGKRFLLHISGNYSFQQASDITDSTHPVYKQVYKKQIAYTPFSSGSANIALETPWVNIAYNLIASGYRYTSGENINDSYSKLDAYTDHSLSAWREITFGKIITCLNIELLNLLNNNYEVVKSYPMPGRSVRFTLSVSY